MTTLQFYLDKRFDKIGDPRIAPPNRGHGRGKPLYRCHLRVLLGHFQALVNLPHQILVASEGHFPCHGCMFQLRHYLS
jgi:hypothetical protein